MTLGEQIQTLRKAAGLSQEELGERLGVARQSVSKWESGSTVPELDKLIAMSKLFGVPVGGLLGLEESEGPDQELTEREMKALEAIAQRLVPAAPAPKRRKRWPYVAAAVAVTVAGWALMSRIHQLENQIGSLHYTISNMDNAVSRQIGSLTGQVRDILEEQNSVIAGKGYEVAEMDLRNGTVTFSLTATPREYREGMEAVFSATGRDFAAVEVPGTLGGGQTFTAELTCPLTDDITLSVGFVTEGSTVSQQLGQEGYLLSQTLADVTGNLSWSVSGVGEKARIDALNADVWQGGSGWYKTREAGGREITAVRGTLRLWVGGELFWSRECEDLSRQSENQGIEIPTGGLSVKAGDQIILSLLYTDSAGRETEAFLDGFWINWEEQPETLAPYAEDERYPWE